MARSLGNFVTVFEELWPIENAEDWDVVGLVVGATDNQISKVLLTVDVTHEVVEYAKSVNADLIFAHHPLLLKGINSLAEDTSKGSIVAELIRSGISLYCAHTNADVVVTGTSSVLAQAIGLVDCSPLTANGIGQLGTLPQSMILGDLAARLNDVLPQTATGVRVAGQFDDVVTRVALCAGAGDSYLRDALDAGADLYITSDLRHHPAQDILELAIARKAKFALIDISHWAAEYLWLATAIEEMSAHLPGIEFEVCELRTDVFEFLMNKPKSQ